MRVRAAMTQTRNAYPAMPASPEGLGSLRPCLADVRDANIAHNVKLLEHAHEQGVQIACLGELFPAPYFAITRDEMWFELAEDFREGPSVLAMREAAARLGMVVIAPIYEQADTGRFNCAVFIDSDGSVVGRARKCHIPRGTNEQGAFDERFYYEGSDGAPMEGARLAGGTQFLPVIETGVGRVGVAICYDRHFEGVVSTLARGGAQIVFSPAVTFGAQSRRLWDMEFQVDAARHRVFIGGSNRLGAEPPWNQEFYGAGYFCGPDGRLDNLSTSNELIIAEVDLDTLRGSGGAGWDLVGDRRAEVFG